MADSQRLLALFPHELLSGQTKSTTLNQPLGLAATVSVKAILTVLIAIKLLTISEKTKKKIITPLRGVLIFSPPALRLSGALGMKKATPTHIAVHLQALTSPC